MKSRHLTLLLCCSLALGATARAEPNNPLTGDWFGTATITSPADIGVVDLAFHLDVTGSAIQPTTSYIDLDHTLLFPPVAPKVNGQDVGPRVSGTLSTGAFSLSTAAFQSTVADRTVKRQVQLSNARITNAGASITGTYTETVSGLGPDPIRITGTFVLARPMPTTADDPSDRSGDGCLDLADIKAGGQDPDRIEFSDLSAALHLYRNPETSLRVGAAPTPPATTCGSADAVIRDALNSYYQAQP